MNLFFPNFMLICYSFASSVLTIPVLSKAHPTRLKSDNFIAIFKHLLLLYYLNKTEPLCVINNIAIATADDIITLSDDVNIFRGHYNFGYCS